MFYRFLSFLVCCIALASSPMYAQNGVPSERLTTVYEFPKVAITGTMTVPEAWKRSQIPSDILKRLTTDALLKSCLKFPFMLEIYATNDVQRAFSFQRDNFNGLQELFKRPDAAITILTLYQRRRTVDASSQASLIESGRFSFELSFIEIFLAQREMVQQFSNVELKALAKECITKYDEKQLDPKSYGGLSLVSTGFVMARILESQQITVRSPNSRSLLEQGVLSNLSDLIEIYNRTKLFVEGK